MCHRLGPYMPLLMVLLLLGAAFSGSPARGAESCSGVAEANLGIADLQPATVDINRFTAAELYRFLQVASAGNFSGYAHPLMVVAREIGGRHNANADTLSSVRSPSGFYCLQPTAGILLFFGVAQRRVYLLDAAANDECIRKALLEHDQEHVRTERQIIGVFLQHNGASVYGRLKELKDAAFEGPTDPINAFVSGADGIVADLSSRLRALGPGFLTPQASDEHREGLREKCRGDVGRLEALLNKKLSD